MIDHNSTLENEKENTANGNISAYDHNMERYNEDECPVFEQIEVPKGTIHILLGTFIAQNLI